MKISRKLALKILKYLDEHSDFYFPFQVMSKDCLDENGNFMEIEPREWKVVLKNNRLENFELWENLQNLYEETLGLMAKGFLERITGESLEKRIATLAKNYRKDWKEELWESEDIEEFGLNEFIGGKADAYEECLELIRRYNKI